MKVIGELIFSTLLLLQAGFCYSSEYKNFILIPDPSSCHQVGVEVSINENSSLGMFGRISCESNRATYGAKNSNVENTFSRILIPWRYSFNGVFTDGYFVQPLAGLENSKFKSTLGSTAEVTFVSLAAYAGYQWFWRNGLNVSLMAGLAYLQEVNSSHDILAGEGSDVSKFLDKNTETNLHGGAGVIVGWLF